MQLISLLCLSNFLFNSLNMSPAESLDFTSEFNITFYLRIVKDAETLYPGDWFARALHDLIRVKLKVGRVRDGTGHRWIASEGFIKVIENFGIHQAVLISEKS